MRMPAIDEGTESADKTDDAVANAPAKKPAAPRRRRLHITEEIKFSIGCKFEEPHVYLKYYFGAYSLGKPVV